MGFFGATGSLTAAQASAASSGVFIVDYSVPSAGSTVTFSSLPAYKAYVITIEAVVDAQGTPFVNCGVRLNNDSSNIYGYDVLVSSVAVSASTGGAPATQTYIATNVGGYANADHCHGTLTIGQTATSGSNAETGINFCGNMGTTTRPNQMHSGGYWPSTTQINRIDIIFDQNIKIGSRFQVYGVN